MFGKFVCQTMFRPIQMGLAAPPLVLSPPLPPYPPQPPSLCSAPLLPHHLLTLTTPGKRLQNVIRVEHSQTPTEVMFLFSQYPSVWAVGCSELSPSHSPRSADHGPLSSESFMQPPNNSRVDGAGWLPGSTHSF